MSTPNKILLILDIDETLIHSAETCLTHGPPHFRVADYHVYRRPNVLDFLTQMADHFQLAFWSSASRDYVDLVLANLLPSTLQPLFVWSRSRCTVRFDPELREDYPIKDLRKVERRGFALERMLIVDDSPSKVVRQFGNAIYVRPFFGEPNDDELVLLGRYLFGLREMTNVRQIEKRWWRQEMQERSEDVKAP